MRMEWLDEGEELVQGNVSRRGVTQCITRAMDDKTVHLFRNSKPYRKETTSGGFASDQRLHFGMVQHCPSLLIEGSLNHPVGGRCVNFTLFTT